MGKETSKEERDKFVFFLGGHDAEMATIKEILLENKVPPVNIKDKHLQWGAKLSDYKDELSKLSTNQIPVLIELTLDIEILPKALIIDHHNDKADKDQKTSLDQIATLLEIKLTRWQQLISANDKGLVWGMQDIDATEKEIKEVRAYDKKCQGITAEDEEKAKTSVEYFSTVISNDGVIIYGQTEKTSTIIDLIYKYYRHIFITTQSGKLTYSGTKQVIELLLKKYSELKKTNINIETWFGGYLPEHGYFGSNISLKNEEIIEIMEPLTEKERIHSQHIFMFPFNIVHDDIKNCSSSIERLKNIHETIKKNQSKWNYKPFEILNTSIMYKNDERKIYSNNEIWAYNEYKYFYDYVRETLYNKIPENELFKKVEDQPISLYYERELLPDAEMVIYIKGERETIIYPLKIEHLSLRIFETGIGILTITLYNLCKSDIDSVLKINDYGRRIYPQFLSEQSGTEDDPVNGVKQAFLPEKIFFKAGGIDSIDTFETNDYISECKHFTNYLEELLKPFYDSVKNKLAITPIIDDRMFVVCWYGNNDLMNRLKTYEVKGRKQSNNERDKMTDGVYIYETDKTWYQYIFVDGNGPLVQNVKMKKELIERATYSRFIDWGTLYGITRYSFMCLCDVDYFPYNIVRNHMQKMYYQMAVLLLAQRASILKFNYELERISKDADELFRNNEETNSIKNNDFDNIIKNTEKLNKDIILFSNRIFFDEVSPQEQGIELYKLAIKNMDIGNEYNSLRNKVSQLYDFVRIKFENQKAEDERQKTEIERQKTTSIQRLTVISIIFAVLVCVLTFWAIDFGFLKYWKGYCSEYECYRMARSLGMLIFSGLAMISLSLLIFHFKKFISLKKSWKWLMYVALIGSIIVYLLMLLNKF